MEGRPCRRRKDGKQLSANRSPVPDPSQVDVAGRGVVVIVVTGGIGSDCALVAPPMILHMAIGEGHDPAAIVRRVGEVEESIAIHVNAEEWPANSIRIHVLEGKQA